MESTKKKDVKCKKETLEPKIDSNNTNSNGKENDNQVPQSANMAEDVIDWQDKYLRLSAEFDNFRKRTLKEKMALIEGGGERVLLPLLSVTDDFQRALPLIQNQNDRQGVELIYKRFLEVLKNNGVTEINALDMPLDVDFHEAVTQLPVEDKTKVGKVVQVIQNGYMHNDRVLRFAKVVVGC